MHVRSRIHPMGRLLEFDRLAGPERDGRGGRGGPLGDDSSDRAAGAVVASADDKLIVAVSGALLLLVGASAAWAAVRHELAPKAPAAMAVGVVLLCTLTLSRSTGALARAIGPVLLVHLVFWVAQFVLVEAGGEYLDFTGLVSDNAARHQTYAYAFGLQGALDRCTGLYAEPADYAVAVFLMVSARASTQGWAMRPLDFAAAATMFLSLSVTGVALGLALLAVDATALGLGRARRIASIGCAALGLPLLYGANAAYIVGRVTEVDRDGSANDRLSGLVAVSMDDWSTFLFGRGVGTYSLGFGRGSGLVDSLLYFGAAGTTLLLACFALMLLRRGTRNWRAAVLWAASLGVAPLQTNLFWWMWGACLCAAA